LPVSRIERIFAAIIPCDSGFWDQLDTRTGTALVHGIDFNNQNGLATVFSDTNFASKEAACL
jgi:hypothetical protein